MPCLCPETRPVAEWCAPAHRDEVPVLREAVTAVAREAGFGDGRVQDVRLAVSEALANAVLHAFVGRERPGSIAVSATVEDGLLSVRICDDGNGLSVGNPASTGLGLGLELMRRCATHVRVADCALRGGTCVTMTFAL
jgi:serine/threonine-protein kinase RsbW